MNHISLGSGSACLEQEVRYNQQYIKVLALKDCPCTKNQQAYDYCCLPPRDMKFKLSHFYVLKINAPGIKA